MYRVDIGADLNAEDDTGYVWTFLDDASEPGRIAPGGLVIAGDDEALAVCRVVDLSPAGDDTIAHLRLLPGLVDATSSSGRWQVDRSAGICRARKQR